MSNNIAYAGAPLDLEIEHVTEIPVLKIDYLDLHGMENMQGVLVFTSKRGIISLKRSGISLEGSRIYCIGGQTAQYLQNLYSLKCKIPKVQNTTGLAELLIAEEESVNIIGSDQVSKDFIERLKSSGLNVHHTITYRVVENADANYDVLSTVSGILVGSSKSFEILHRNAKGMLNGKKLYAIGKPTENTMLSLGYRPTECFDTPDIAEILRSLITER